MKSQYSTRNLVTMALFAAILCVSAYISVPLPNGSHITFLNFILLIIALLFPASQSFLISLVWLLLGAVGIPVFISGAAGIGYLMSAWGGYNFGFIFVTFFIPLIRPKQYKRIIYTILAILGAVLINLIGMFWLMVVGELSLKAAFLQGFVTFIPLDLVKAIVAAQIIPAFRRIILLNQVDE